MSRLWMGGGDQAMAAVPRIIVSAACSSDPSSVGVRMAPDGIVSTRAPMGPNSAARSAGL